jgi:hypothetical protein
MRLRVKVSETREFRISSPPLHCPHVRLSTFSRPAGPRDIVDRSYYGYDYIDTCEQDICV